MNMMVAFYAATFPGIVQDLPEVIQSEKEVLEGTREWVNVLFTKICAKMVDPPFTTSSSPISGQR